MPGHSVDDLVSNGAGKEIAPRIRELRFYS